MAYFCFLEKEVIQCSVLSCLIPWHKLDNLLIIVVQAFLVFFSLSSSSPFHMQAKVRAEQQITQSFPSEIITGLWYKNVMGMIIIQQWCNACSFSLHCGPILGYQPSFLEFQTFWSRSWHVRHNYIYRSESCWDNCFFFRKIGDNCFSP